MLQIAYSYTNHLRKFPNELSPSRPLSLLRIRQLKIKPPEQRAHQLVYIRLGHRVPNALAAA